MFEVMIFLKEEGTRDQTSSYIPHIDIRLRGSEGVFDFFFKLLKLFYVIKLEFHPYVPTILGLTRLLNLLLKLLPCNLSIEKIVQAVYGDFVWSCFCISWFFSLVNPARPDREHNIRSLPFYIRPKKLVFLISDASRVVVIQGPVQVNKMSARIGEWFKVGRGSRGRSTPEITLGRRLLMHRGMTNASQTLISFPLVAGLSNL
jgi:hypothetical protein